MRQERRAYGPRGFTLIELMIVVAIIAIIAAIAIPNLMSARLSTQETASLATLRNIWTGQAQFQNTVQVDVDNDGSGEFGFFRELTGATGRRLSADGTSVGARVSQPSVSAAMRTIDANGGAGRTGYRFQIFLPTDLGEGVYERPTGAFTDDVGTELAETTFAMYAWPASYASTGNRTFFINQQGDLSFTDDPDYSGANFYIDGAPGVAFRGAGSLDSITGDVATGTIGRDGNMWRPVN